MDLAAMMLAGNYAAAAASGVYVDPFLKRQKIEDMEPEEFLTFPISDLNQTGQLVAGPGAKRDVAASILGVALPKVERRDEEDIARAKKYAMEQSIKYVLMKQTLAHQQQQAKSLQRHQALVLMCRVYIGSISFELREDTIRQAFAPFGPIKTINMSWDPVAQKHKGFAFVEYDLPEAAQLALEQMNGVMIGGRNIKCGRDTRIKFSHMDQVIDDLMDEAKIYHRIYVASIHADLSEEDIKSVFEAFGKIMGCKLAPGPTPGKHRGYGFIEYETGQSAAEAIASMNLFDLGGQYLRVGKAITPPNALQVLANPGQNQMPTAAAVAAAAATAKIQALEAVTNTAAALGLTTEPILSRPMMSEPSSSGLGFGMPQTPKLSSSLAAPQLVAPTSLGTLSSPTVSSLNLSPASSGSALPPPGLAIPGVGILPSGQPFLLSQSSLTPHGTPSTSQIPNAIGGFSGGVSSIPPPGIAAIPTTAVIPQPGHSGFLSMSTAGTWGVNKTPEKASAEDPRKKIALEETESLTLSQQENLSIKGQSARHLVMQKLMRQESSSVIVLRNMVSPEDVDDSLKDEITDECSNYGTVKRVVIYQEHQSEDDDANVVVKIFVEFSSPTEAEAARSFLHGRFFGGRRVIGEIYDYGMYKMNDLSG